MKKRLTVSGSKFYKAPSPDTATPYQVQITKGNVGGWSEIARFKNESPARKYAKLFHKNQPSYYVRVWREGFK